MDASEVGRYGTLKLMKRNDPSAVAAVFPIDEEEITFGRDVKCDVRLYYDSVSAVHCKVMFQERKAFLVVLGTNGVWVDDSPVYPSSNPASPATIPLSTNSKIEIHKKLFIFQYPPKELRPILIATPARPGKVRMSMIHSAQVFTPRPSDDPRENLRLLQSPVKSPVKGEEIVLVDGNHPRVTQEENDLVILEDVPQIPRPAPVLSTPSKPPVFPPRTPVYRTPRPARPPRPSLHRAVLIRSAQRTALRVEIERETEEEKEVEEVVAGILEDDEDEEMDGGDDVRMDDEEEDSPSRPSRASGWQRPFEAVRGLLRSLSRSPERQLHAEDEHDEDDNMDETEDATKHEEEQEDQDEYTPMYPDLPTTPSPAGTSAEHDQPAVPQPHFKTPEQGQRLQFMTPQAQRPPPGARVFTPPRTALRPSLGKAAYDGPRRVKVEPPWKVKDIAVAVGKEGDGMGTAKAEDGFALSPRKREKVDEAERKAILERRRSALHMPDPFFGGQIPGVRRVGSVSPAKAPAMQGEQPEMKKEEAKEGDEDARTLLEKVKEANEDMNRRRSARFEQLAVTPSPAKKGKARFSLIAPDAMPMANFYQGAQDEDEDIAMSDAQEDEPPQEDVEQAEQHAQPSDSVPRTPRLDLRHLFGQQHQPALQTPAVRGVRDLFVHNAIVGDPSASPRMDGVRNMFLPEKEMPSAVLDGVGDMMATPEGWKANAAPEPEPEPEAELEAETAGDVEMEEEPPASNPRARKTPAAAKSKATRSTQIPKTAAPTRKRVARTPATGASQLADDEATPQTRGPSKSTADTDDEVDVAGKSKASVKKPRVLRGRRVADVEATASTEPPHKPEAKDSCAPQLETVPEDAPMKTSKATASKRKAPASKARGATSESEAPDPAARRTVRRGRSADHDATATDSEAAPSKTKPAPRTRGAKTKPIDVDTDELDFIERPTSPEHPPDAKSKPTKRGAGKVKQEDNDDGVVRAVRATATTPATKARKTPARGRAKDAAAPSTAGESSCVEGIGDKENTPESGSTPAEEAPAPAKKGRTAKPRVKTEEPPQEVPKTTRATRARAAKKT
ncbi:hypothetical protein GLOTRDRAFT_141481 [Gloeophyllum trabeum ATCC 11539]|uniref:FHA domain-containing protein n=1 Tax=Gloeophyllum trabeum (strain ATCC 11539 / FP-39264 / Madison 617) TaxID=670483 RepID=S7RDK8_GLOTA|nr:uncharacterized protein GLOTRDRAFT_141481 [Gloeophyllum trabeum ATCC 11539]EPQ50494.1 hypothetical protein GLOTRDRAFT_141481 [Gloeophyllum trabeum ATCC 11539]